jgi:NifU-like protein involved in Fe-S cluster formation
MHCSNLGADALHKAIEEYRKRKVGEGVSGGEK